VYDNSDNGMCGFFCGARAWWMFKLFGHDKVSVLEGGIMAWNEGGHSTVEQGEQCTNIEVGNFSAVWHDEFYHSFDMLSEVVRQPSGPQIIDTRSSDQYHGKQDVLKSGHIPGATHINIKDLAFDAKNNKLKQPDDIKKAIAKAGVDLSKPIVGHCNGGMSSCSLLLATHLIGKTDTSLYMGGFTEWKGRCDSEENFEK